MYSKNWKLIREKILKRDNYKCTNPKCKSSENLAVHHIDRNKENNSETNLITLCNKCHLKEHKEDAKNALQSKSKNERKSKNTIIDKETGVMSGQRKIRKIGDTHYINIPKEFLQRHGIKEGDVLPFAAGYLLEFIPMQEK